MCGQEASAARDKAFNSSAIPGRFTCRGCLLTPGHVLGSHVSAVPGVALRGARESQFPPGLGVLAVLGAFLLRRGSGHEVGVDGGGKGICGDLVARGRVVGVRGLICRSDVHGLTLGREPGSVDAPRTAGGSAAGSGSITW